MSHQSEKFRRGDIAPDFELPNQKGEPRRLTTLLEDGPVMLVFHRGTW